MIIQNKKNVQKQFSNIFYLLNQTKNELKNEFTKKSFDNLNHLYIIQRRM